MASASIAGGFALRSSDVGLPSVAVRHGRPAGRPKVFRVNCMAEPQPETKSEDLKTTTGPASARPAPKASTNFRDVFAFSGEAPETINGRLAMVGFVSALGVELWTGNDLLTQLSSGGVAWFAVTATLLTGASLVPMFQGVSKESRSQTVMSSTAETWNGRFAMLGLMALALTEYVKGGPLV